jgi:hypothetical protein
MRTLVCWHCSPAKRFESEVDQFFSEVDQCSSEVDQFLPKLTSAPLKLTSFHETTGKYYTLCINPALLRENQ